ncbi:hypothetical protein CBL_10607 [Carabus blaptoides fortunei]
MNLINSKICSFIASKAEQSSPDRNQWAEQLSALPNYIKDVQLRIQRAYEKSAARYNLGTRPLELQFRQLVWKCNFSLSDAAAYYSVKLGPKYIECRILKRISQNLYQLCRNEDDKIIGNWHIKDIKTISKTTSTLVRLATQ